MVTRVAQRALVLAVMLDGARTSGDELPAVVAVEKITDAEPQFKAIEDQLKALGFPASGVRNLTVPLQTAVGDALKANPQVAIYPRAVLDLCASELRAGADKEELRRRLVQEQASGGFQRRTAAARLTEHRCKNVRFESLERVATPDPHLTAQFTRAHLKEKSEKNFTGVYKLTIRGSDGKVDGAQVVQSIPGADQDLIDQIKASWQFKPGPEAICTVRELNFQIGE